MFEIIYRSKAVSSFGETDAVDLLVQARKNNEKRNLTGFLFFDGDYFLQVLEGEKANVEETYQNIVHDKRHGQIETLWSQYSSPIDHRTFPDWSMACLKLPGGMIDQDFQDQPFRSQEPISHGARLFRILSCTPHLGAQPFMTDTAPDLLAMHSSVIAN